MMHVLLLTSGVFVFNGGNVWDFTKQVSATTKRPAVFLVGESDRVRRANFTYASPAVMVQQLRREANLDPSSSENGGFVAGGWPWAMVWRYRSAPVSNIAPDGSLSIVVDKGEWTVRPDARKITSLQAIALKTSKPIRSHWFFQSAQFVLAADHATESDVMLGVAEALGADLLIGESFEFRFNARRFRERAIAFLSRSAPEPKTYSELALATTTKLGIAALRQMSDAQIEAVYQAPNAQDIVLDAPESSPLGQAVKERLQAYFSTELIPAGNGWQSLRDGIETYRQGIDLSKPAQVSVRASGAVLVRLPGLDKNTWFYL